MYEIQLWMWGRFIYSLPPELIVYIMGFLQRAEVVCLRGHSSTFEEFTINLHLDSRPDNFYAPYPKDNGWSLSDWENYRSMEQMSKLYIIQNSYHIIQPLPQPQPQLHVQRIQRQSQPQSQSQRHLRIVRTYKPPVKNIKQKSIYRYHLR